MTSPRAAQPSELGALLSDHPQRAVGSRGRFIQSYVALGIGAALLLIAGAAFLLMPNAQDQISVLCLGFGGIGGLGLGLAGLGDARRTLDGSLRLYERGLRYQDRQGLKTWLWADVTALWHLQQYFPSSRITRHAYQLTHRSGDTLQFGDLVRDPAAAYDTARRMVYPLIAPGLTAAFEGGAPVAFGPVTLDAAGVHIKGRTMPWAEVLRAQVVGGSLLIERRGGGWFNDADLDIGAVPNSEILIDLVGRRAGR